MENTIEITISINGEEKSIRILSEDDITKDSMKKIIEGLTESIVKAFNLK